MEVGDYITVKYVSAYKTTRIGFLKVNKIGHKYLYGTTLWVDPGEEIKLGHEIRYNMENLVIYSGVRRDLKEILDKYEEEYREWQQIRSKKDREIDWELKTLKEERLDEWKKENPIPQLSEFPKPN